MTALLFALPPFFTLLLLATWNRQQLQSWFSLCGMLFMVFISFSLLWEVRFGEIISWQVGGWDFPLGITVVIDRFAALMCAMSTIVGLAIVIYARSHIDDQSRHSAWQPLVHMLMWGVIGAFCTGDLFNLFVWFEVMLMASFVLMTLGGGKQRLEGAIKYVAINLLGSVIFLCGCGIIYGLCGTLNFASIAHIVSLNDNLSPALMAAQGCLLVAFLLKAGAFPLFAWLPASYHTVGAATAALFSALLTKVGVYAVLRLSITIIPISETVIAPALLIISLLTMVIGVLGAATQMELKRILAFHIISQVGYLLLAIAIGSPLALAAAILYILHNNLAKSNLFLIAGIASARGGHNDVRKLGGMRHDVVLYIGFLIAAGSLAGIPPLSGFFAKLAVIRAAFDLTYWMSGAIALVVGFITLYSMIKIHREVFAKNHPDQSVIVSVGKSSYLGVLLLGCGSLILALGIGKFWPWCLEVGTELSARTPYLEAVLGVSL